ncbi:MAG: hypothetical protein LAN83_15085 [Acidobacteriia bacterium]|nr:hypothetical protein [Terriglobia bacterium]
MQRHFSNRGEALAEMAAAKMMAGRKSPTKSGLTGQRMMPGQWRAPVVEVIRPGRPVTKKESKAKVKSVLEPPEL